MTEGAYALGVDFGTESGRAVLLELDSGRELAVSEVRYAHGVLDRELPDSGEQLPPDWALQHSDDWLAVLDTAIPAVLEQVPAAREGVVGLGVDFTSCTVLPVTADGQPLFKQQRWSGRRHAWPKLWKHHAAQPIADRLNDVATARGESFLGRYGGRISSEWYFPKLIELWLEDREAYDACHGFVEATDWIVWQLTGNERRQSCTAGYKAMWSQEEGLPPVAYFEAAYPGFDEPAAKLGSEFAPLGTRAGTLRGELAERFGLRAPVAVAVGNVDSFVSVPGAGVDTPGTFVMVVGTSICDLVVDPVQVRLPGITGVVRDGILPGLYGYEAGQAAAGDMLAWFVETLAPPGCDHETLERAAGALAPGASGLVALDWWNGNRTILADADLSGVLVGLTLQTTREQIYRALLESIAFGNRRIIENFEEHGMKLSEIVACGGIAEKSPLTMQLLADTSGMRVSVPDSAQVPARGAALFGALAAGHFPDIAAAIAATRPPIARSYEPQPQAREVYDRVYAVYRDLYERLGRSHPELLHDLKHIHAEYGLVKPRIGLLGIMQELYDAMLPGITERQAAYAGAVAERLADVADVQFIRPARNREDIEEIVKEYGTRGLDGIAIVMLTYGPAMRTVRALAETPLPVLLANIQPERAVTASWDMADLTYNQGIHGAQDQANALVRGARPFSVITGEWDSDGFAADFADWAHAAATVTALRSTRIALFGYPMNGMGDILYDPPAMLRRLGPVVIAEDLGGLYRRIEGVSDDRIGELVSEHSGRFEIDPGLPHAAHVYAVRFELALRDLLEEEGYDGFSAHFDSIGGDGRFEQLPLLAASDLMADGYGYAAEGDTNTTSLMCAAQTLIGDAHFSELYAMDFELDSVLVSHMGEGNWKVARDDRPVRLIDRELGIGGLGNPPTTVFSAQPGPATTAALVPLEGESYRLVIGRGDVLDTPELPNVEMPYFHFRPHAGVRDFMDGWLGLGGPHHFVTNLGEHTQRWRRVGELLDLEVHEL